MNIKQAQFEISRLEGNIMKLEQSINDAKKEVDDIMKEITNSTKNHHLNEIIKNERFAPIHSKRYHYGGHNKITENKLVVTGDYIYNFGYTIKTGPAGRYSVHIYYFKINNGIINTTPKNADEIPVPGENINFKICACNNVFCYSYDNNIYTLHDLENVTHKQFDWNVKCINKLTKGDESIMELFVVKDDYTIKFYKYVNNLDDNYWADSDIEEAYFGDNINYCYFEYDNVGNILICGYRETSDYNQISIIYHYNRTTKSWSNLSGKIYCPFDLIVFNRLTSNFILTYSTTPIYYMRNNEKPPASIEINANTLEIKIDYFVNEDFLIVSDTLFNPINNTIIATTRVIEEDNQIQIYELDDYKWSTKKINIYAKTHSDYKGTMLSSEKYNFIVFSTIIFDPNDQPTIFHHDDFVLVYTLGYDYLKHIEYYLNMNNLVI